MQFIAVCINNLQEAVLRRSAPLMMHLLSVFRHTFGGRSTSAVSFLNSAPFNVPLFTAVATVFTTVDDLFPLKDQKQVLCFLFVVLLETFR